MNHHIHRGRDHTQKNTYHKPKLSEEQKALRKLTKELHKLFAHLKFISRNRGKDAAPADIRNLISESVSHTSSLTPQTSNQ